MSYLTKQSTHTLRMLKKFYMTLPGRMSQRTCENPLPGGGYPPVVGQFHGDWMMRRILQFTAICLQLIVCVLYIQKSTLVSLILLFPPNTTTTECIRNSPALRWLKIWAIRRHVCREELEDNQTVQLCGNTYGVLE